MDINQLFLAYGITIPMLRVLSEHTKGTQGLNHNRNSNEGSINVNLEGGLAVQTHSLEGGSHPDRVFNDTGNTQNENRVLIDP